MLSKFYNSSSIILESLMNFMVAIAAVLFPSKLALLLKAKQLTYCYWDKELLNLYSNHS